MPRSLAALRSVFWLPRHDFVAVGPSRQARAGRITDPTEPRSAPANRGCPNTIRSGIAYVLTKSSWDVCVTRRYKKRGLGSHHYERLGLAHGAAVRFDGGTRLSISEPQGFALRQPRSLAHRASTDVGADGVRTGAENRSALPRRRPGRHVPNVAGSKTPRASSNRC